MTRIEYESGLMLGDYGCVFIQEVSPVAYGDGSPRRCAEFECHCGKVFTCLIDSIKRSKTKSCGCLNDEARINTGKSKRTHGLSKTPLYNCWTRMKSRCYNTNNKDYKEYGGRGILVCERWRTSFENFHSDMGETYTKGLELDRIDVNKGYSPENCRWATEQTQSWNQRRYKNNKSGKTGVTWNKKAHKWEVRISKDGVEHYIGFYEDLGSAIKSREEAELEFYGHNKE